MPLIRPEQSGDFDTVHALLLASFGREVEARLVDRLRASGKISSALVAEDRAHILGHVVFSKVITEAGAGEVGALALAPLAVAPAFQRLGIGSALISAWFGYSQNDETSPGMPAAGSGCEICGRPAVVHSPRLRCEAHKT